MRNSRGMGAAALVLAAACGGPLGPGGEKAPAGPAKPALAESGVDESVTGGGQFVHPDFGTVTFSFVAIRHPDGRVTGRFQQHQLAFGFTYKGDVTCVAVDPVNHRAWIGGVLTQSNDADPVAQVGKDAWFRVLDPGGSNAADRSTFLGFEGGGGILTSAQYCQARIWPEGNARTWPVEQGNVVLH
jgi:hypothetical protein